MAFDFEANETWRYAAGVLTHVGTGQTYEIDIAANEELHLLLSGPHWLHLGDPQNYSEDPADWVERRLYYNRINEDPKVLGVELTIGQDDREDFTLIPLEDAPGYGESLQAIADTLQDGVDNPPFARAHARVIVEEIVRMMQRADLLAQDPFNAPETP